MFVSRPVEERFWEKVQKTEGCWLWTGCMRAGKFQYGRLRFPRRMELAHRASWILAYGPIPPGDGFHGTCVLHRCDNPRCVRPDHLFLGTMKDNIHDMFRKGRGNVEPAHRVVALKKRSATRCKYGHELSGDNLYMFRGRRSCRACHARRERERRVRCRRRHGPEIRHASE